MEFFAGVDTHRDTHSIAVLDEVGKVVDSFTISATRSGYAEALERTEQFRPLIWGLEGTGSYGRPFADFLLEAKAVVHEVPGAISKRHRRRLRRRGKSDPQDAHAIAEAVLREHESLPLHLQVDSQEATRILYERRDRKVSERTEKVNRLRAFALRLEVPLPKDITSQRALDELNVTLQSRTTRGYADREIIAAMEDLVADIRRLSEAISALEKRLGPFVERLAPKLLEMYGCSLISAAGVIGHSGSITNYRNADAFASRAGVAPIQCSSGKHQSVRVNTGGDRQLNRCLHNIANAQIKRADHAGRVYYDRKRAEGKTHREALRCLKRRLATVVFRVLQSGAISSKTTNALPMAA